MEPVGVEPTSRNKTSKTSTCVAVFAFYPRPENGKTDVGEPAK
jgi:hypothetical protein